MSANEDSDDDWFNKDEEELLNNLKINAPKDDKQNEKEKTEYIEPLSSTDQEYLLNQRLEAATKNVAAVRVPRIQTSDLRKLVQKESALEIFLFAFTHETPDFFVDQIAPNDSMERITLYMRVLSIISNLKIPGFHDNLIKHFAMNAELLEHIRIIATKMFTKRYEGLWATTNDKERFDRIICDMQTLLVQASKLNVISVKVLDTIQNVLRLIDQSDTPKIIERPVCAEFTKELKQALTSANNVAGKLKESVEIYPTLAELTNNDRNEDDPFENISLSTYEYKSISEYLKIQQQTLRADFIISLKSVVHELKENQKLGHQFASQVLHFEKVQIVLNENFLNARRHEMLFVDINPDKKIRDKALPILLSTLKTGTLLCFSTNYEFDNLILAVVTYQHAELSRNGYIAIEVVRQYNIGNIHNKQLIMFTSPAFFEPYHNVYNYLITCSVDDFPMKEHIVFGKTNVDMPSYLTDVTIFKADKHNFNPTQEPPPLSVPLNGSQREAVKQALTQTFSLIQGPPGTGKTHTSVQLVKMLVENQIPKPIVIVAYTNESLDKFLLKISTYTSSIARFGSQTRLREIAKFNVDGMVQSELISPRLKRLYFIINTKYKAAFAELQLIQKEFDGTDEGYQRVISAQQNVRSVLEQLNTIRMIFKYYVVRQRSIVALTTTCAGKMNFLLRLLGCRIVVFEEAAEILESHVLACLTPHIQHVIMIGDHMQLKPYTSNNQHSRSCDLNISLFERLIIRNILKPTVLTTQYRMRPIIAELLCPFFYETLQNDDSVEQYPLVRNMKKNLYFVKHQSQENRTKKDLSLYNKSEAKRIINLACYLVEKAKYNCEDIVILSPYAGQVNLIKSQMPPCLKLMRVQTVDGFQGLEATIVLLSLVRNNSDGRIGFLAEKNRICVALSRAKHGLYIIGGLDLLVSCSDNWRTIASKLASYNLIGTDFPFADGMIEEISSDSDG